MNHTCEYHDPDARVGADHKPIDLDHLESEIEHWRRARMARRLDTRVLSQALAVVRAHRRTINPTQEVTAMPTTTAKPETLSDLRVGDVIRTSLSRAPRLQVATLNRLNRHVGATTKKVLVAMEGQWKDIVYVDGVDDDYIGSIVEAITHVNGARVGPRHHVEIGSTVTFTYKGAEDSRLVIVRELYDDGFGGFDAHRGGDYRRFKYADIERSVKGGPLIFVVRTAVES